MRQILRIDPCSRIHNIDIDVAGSGFADHNIKLSAVRHGTQGVGGEIDDDPGEQLPVQGGGYGPLPFNSYMNLLVRCLTFKPGKYLFKKGTTAVS